MKLTNGKQSYDCITKYHKGAEVVFTLSEEPKELTGTVKLISDVDDPPFELYSLKAGDYSYQYIVPLGSNWTIRFTNTEFVPPAPVEPVPYVPTETEQRVEMLEKVVLAMLGIEEEPPAEVREVRNA